MANTFTVDGVEYKIVRNPYTNGPMIARVDGFSISNRKEVCRRFLRTHGWTDSMFGDRITNDLERQINKILNGDGNIPAPRLSETYNKSSFERARSFSPVTAGEKVDLSVHVNKFIEVYDSDENGRYLSYDHIRKAFLEYRKDEDMKDLLALNLYAYLASWGMLRNSFLQQKDYKFLTPVIAILSDPKYESLIDYNPFNDRDKEKAPLMMKLIKRIRNFFIGETYYEEGTRKLKSIDNVSDTLVTKILLGTLGCTIAYDTYAKKGLSSHGMIQKVGIDSIMELRAFAKANEAEIKELLSKLNELYTPMKIIDMYFFEEGFTV